MYSDEQYHILALKNGSKDSFRWLFNRYHHTLCSYIWSIFKNDQWTEDICSEVFIAVWLHRENLKPESFEAYIFQIAKNKVLNRLKKTAADARQEEEFVRRHLDYINTVKRDEENHRQKMDLLKNEMNNLPPRRKEILERKYFQGQKNAQIAQEMDISIHTVKAQLYKARLHLKSRLKRSDPKADKL